MIWRMEMCQKFLVHSWDTHTLERCLHNWVGKITMLRRKTKIFHCQVILKYIQLFLYSRLLLMFLQFKIMFQPPCTHDNILWLFFFYPKCYYWIWQILLLLAFIQHPLSHHQKGITQHKDCCVASFLFSAKIWNSEVRLGVS